MSILLIESQYFGAISYYKKILEYEDILIEAHDFYVKMSFRNRCMIPGANGLINLSVPIEKGRNYRQLMQDVKISYRENWINQHMRTIDSCYNRAPFFEYYRDDLFSILNKKHELLLSLNTALLSWVFKNFKINKTVNFTHTFHTSLLSNTIDSRNCILPKNFQTTDTEHIKYLQVFEDRIGFMPNMSIIDLLFCAGPTAINLLISNDNQ